MHAWFLPIVLGSLVQSAADAVTPGAAAATTNEVVIVTWATPAYLRAFGAVVEHNRRWAAANGVPYIVDTADYLGTLPPPRQATWGKVLALRRALDECTDATLPFQSHCLEQGGKEQPQPQQQQEEEEQQQQQQQQQRRLPPSAVLLLDADCALMGTADMLKALLSAGGGDDDECGGSGTARSAPHITAARYPLTGPATATFPAISNGGLWVNSGALLVRKSSWSLKFVEEWWRLSSAAHWYGGDQGALWLLLADALAADDMDAKLWDERRRGERPIYRACLKEGIPTHSRLLQRCLSPFLPFDSHGGSGGDRNQNARGVVILDPRDYEGPRPMHFWSAMDIALNRRFLAGGLFDSSFVRSTLTFRHGGEQQLDLIVQTKNPREVVCGAPCLSWAERSSRRRSIAPGHDGDSKPRVVVLSVNEGAFLVYIPLHTTGVAAGADAGKQLLTTAKLVAWSTCGDVRIGFVDPASCTTSFLSVLNSEDRTVLIPVGFLNAIVVHGQPQEADDSWQANSPWSSRSETRRLVCELMRSQWHWNDSVTCAVDIASVLMSHSCTRGLARSWCIAHNATVYPSHVDTENSSAERNSNNAVCRALVVLNITDASAPGSTTSSGLLVGQVKVSEQMALCIDGSSCESSVAFVEDLYHLNHEWSLRHDHGTSDVISNAIIGAHRSALTTHARAHWSEFFQCAPAPAAPKRRILQDYTRCSESHLWKLMMSFYDRKGIDSWSSGVVPHFITSNSFIGKAYATILKGYLRDLEVQLDPSQPLYIIELGSGSGKFGYYMLNALVKMKDTLGFPIERICYVMTDFTESNFNYWEEHPQLKLFFESGQLESAIFNAATDTTITLAHSGVVLSPGSVTNPICIVANYLFDTLSHDIFQVVPSPTGGLGILKAGLVSVGSRRAEEEDPLDPEIIKRLDNRFRYVEIGDNYYDDEDDDGIHFERILHWYRNYFSRSDESALAPPDRRGASILLPIGALRALRRLSRFAAGCLVVSGDKGNSNPEQFRGLLDPHTGLGLHPHMVHGSFSVMVNYHAIGAYFTSRGGFVLHNPQEEASLKVSAFVLTGNDDAAAEGASAAAGEGDKAGPRVSAWTGDQIEARSLRRAKAFPHLGDAFYSTIEQFGPHDFFVMQKAMKEDVPTPSLKSVVALLKLSDHDPDVFYTFRDVIVNQVPNYGSNLRNDLLRSITRIWDNFFMLDAGKDVAFEIGRVYYATKEYAKALEFYTISSESFGEHHLTAHNIGLCYYSMSKLAESLKCFSRALSLNYDYEEARSWRSKVENELAGKDRTKDEEREEGPLQS